jgi:hypothetical protein
MKYTEEEAKKKIVELIEDFKINRSRFKKEAEANTETKLVEPLFEILGWTKNDFVKQEKFFRGKKTGLADYAFKIKNKTVFVLEVKRVGVSLDREANKQVISYALSKRVPFAVATNFERLSIFCVEQERAINNVFRTFLNPDEYLSKFHNLLFLSKESFEKGLILKEAENERRLKKRISIDKPLLEDLMRIRGMIASDIEKKYPKKYEINEKDEIVQRILDRLIFIRKCEDTGINPNNMYLEEIKNFSDEKAYPRLREFFKKYNDVYDSGLFLIGVDNDCDKILIDGSIIKELVGYLYRSKDEEYIYNFDWIDADILGQVYEQYLGKILEQTRSGKAKLKEGQVHRKEQGIYYTPTYIVDYIVKNTVKDLLKNKKIKAKHIKILDPACGSGSFLIKVFDYLHETLSSNKEAKQYKMDDQGAYSIKTEILKNNLYGVDLDNKAVEITKLNLLLKAAEGGRKLPEEVDRHIKHGNSLIDDETIVGMNAFNWEKEFKEIMEKGGFDIIIGNPPYVNIYTISKNKEEVAIYQKNFETAYKKFDLYVLFMERAIKKLKEKGKFSFIVPDKWLYLPYGEKLRLFILKTCVIEKIVDLTKFRVFKSATNTPVVFVFKKESNKSIRDNNKIEVITPKENAQDIVSEDIKISYVNQSVFEETPKNMFRIRLTKEVLPIIKKIDEQSLKFGDICYVNWGCRPVPLKKFYINKKIDEKHKPAIKGENIFRYTIKYTDMFLNYDPPKLYNPVFQELFERDAMIIKDIGGGKAIYATINDNHYYNPHTVINCLLKDTLKDIKKFPDKDIKKSKSYDLRFLLGLINSKLILFYFKILITDFLHTVPDSVRLLPIKEIKSLEQEPLIKLVDKILDLNKRLNEIGDKKTDKRKRIEEEIERTDKEIDELVYKLYGITEKEKKIIEESLK